jgi:hypothetical protein
VLLATGFGPARTPKSFCGGLFGFCCVIATLVVFGTDLRVVGFPVIDTRFFVTAVADIYIILWERSKMFFIAKSADFKARVTHTAFKSIK